MLDNAVIQSAWIVKLKSISALTARVPAVEIREDSYKGNTFTYPNVRVKLGPLTPTTNQNTCQVFRSDCDIIVFIEQKSSKTADEIAGIIAAALWGHPFTSGTVKFNSVNLTSVIPAGVPEWDSESWAAEVNFTCTVQSA